MASRAGRVAPATPRMAGGVAGSQAKSPIWSAVVARRSVQAAAVTGRSELSRRPYAPGARVRATSAVAPGGTRTARSSADWLGPRSVSTVTWTSASPTVGVDEAQGGRRRDIETRHHLRGRGCRCRRGVVDAARRRAVDPLVGQDGRDDTTRRDDVHRRGRLVGRQGVERDDDALSAGWRGCAPRRRDGAPAAEDVEGHGHGVGAGVAHDEALGARGAGAASDEPGVGCRKAAGGHDEAAVVVTRVPPDLGGQETGRQRARRTRHDRRGGGHGRGDESVDRAPWP